MSPTWLLIPCTLVLFFAYDLSKISVPEEALEPFNVRIFLYVQKLYLLRGDIDELLWGKEYRYKQWIADMRKSMAAYEAKPERIEDGLKIKDVVFNDVPVRLFYPLTRRADEGALMWFHGGGWVISSIDGHDGLCREAALEMNILVVAVEYRLAPEYPYPAALDDCYTATKHFLENAARYETDPTRIAVAGDSAGGNLATAVALRLRDEKMTPTVKLQILLYPVVQSVNFDLPSYKENQYDTLLPRDIMVAMWLCYAQGNMNHMDVLLQNNHVPKEIQNQMTTHGTLASAADEHESYNETVWNSLKHVMLDPYFAPLMAKNLTGLPKALVYTVTQDILKDESTLYAKRLKDSGNDVEHYHNRGGFHALNSLGLPFHSWVGKDAKFSNSKIRIFIKNNL